MIYGHRVLDKKEKIFNSNPLKSVSGSVFSPIPKAFLDKMATLSMNRQKEAATNNSPSSSHCTKVYQQAHQYNRPTSMAISHPTGDHPSTLMEDTRNNKRKLMATKDSDNSSAVTQKFESKLADLSSKASQSP